MFVKGTNRHLGGCRDGELGDGLAMVRLSRVDFCAGRVEWVRFRGHVT